jgi:NADH-quinone oxidoreductase subunit J
MITQVYFWIFSMAALLTALGVLVSRHPIHAAISLIGTMVSLAGIYSLIASPFLATLQILVYAGAIIMLLVFVIMVLNSAKDEHTPRWDLTATIAVVPALAVGAFLLMVIEKANAFQPFGLAPADAPAARGTVETLSRLLFPDQLGAWSFLFLVVGLLLLSAIVGAVLLAKRHLDGAAASSNPHSGGHR